MIGVVRLIAAAATTLRGRRGQSWLAAQGWGQAESPGSRRRALGVADIRLYHEMKKFKIYDDGAVR